MVTEKEALAYSKTIVFEMAITDGSKRTNGEKWTLEDTVEIGRKAGVDFSVIHACEWYMVMNMMYSDYYNVAKKYNLVDSLFFADLSLAWFYDVDSEEDKTFKYFFGC